MEIRSPELDELDRRAEYFDLEMRRGQRLAIVAGLAFGSFIVAGIFLALLVIL